MKKSCKILIGSLFAAVLLLAVILLTGLFENSEAPAAPQPSTQTESPQTTAAETTQCPPQTVPETVPETKSADELRQEQLDARARELLAEMTGEEKLCQLMMVSVDTLTGGNPTTVAGTRTSAALQQYPIGGLVFSQGNFQTREQTVSMLSGMQSMSKTGLLLGVTEEGGTVWRVMKNSSMGTTVFDSMYSYRDSGTQTAYENAKTIAQDLAGLGLNVDFAPVADVWSNPQNTVIGKRAYSDDFAQAAELVAAAVEGFRDGGMICSVKHFPGHGCTAEDSHRGLARVDRTAEELRAEELLPFAAGIRAGAPMVMIGHLQVDAFDPDYPASVSYEIITKLLREELGFDGVVITDSLGMGALNGYTEAEKCILALNAGCDLLLGVTDIGGVLQALADAVADGTVPAERIEESVLRILRLKLEYGILPDS